MNIPPIQIMKRRNQTMTEIRAITGSTPQGRPIASLVEGVPGVTANILAKMFPNDAGTKIRIVINSLNSFRQTLINIDEHYIEVDL